MNTVGELYCFLHMFYRSIRCIENICFMVRDIFCYDIVESLSRMTLLIRAMRVLLNKQVLTFLGIDIQNFCQKRLLITRFLHAGFSCIPKTLELQLQFFCFFFFLSFSFCVCL